jgi:hypothetical protein
MKVRRIPRTIDRWQDEHGADNFSGRLAAGVVADEVPVEPVLLVNC